MGMECCRGANPFRLCSGLKVIGYFMILLVASIIAVSYCAVIVISWGPRLFRGGLVSVLAFAIVLVFHLLLALLIWSYFMVVFVDPGSVPLNWRPTIEEENLEIGSSMTLSDYVAPATSASAWSSSEGSDKMKKKKRNSAKCAAGLMGVGIRIGMEGEEGETTRKLEKNGGFCSWWQKEESRMQEEQEMNEGKKTKKEMKEEEKRRGWSFVGSSVRLLKIPGHFGTLVKCLDALALLPRFIKFFGDARNHNSSPGKLAVTFLAFVLNLAFALSLVCFVVMHASLVLSNTTTIEVYEKKKAAAWKYDVGKRRNFEQVFGTKKLLWFLPLYSQEDLEKMPALQGLDFPTRSDVET
ncbi:S-acyltransferase [Cocos nucifera]|uniref:S-acyltransferase n=1 Tax=Cocos nucifera TaxID=13894 RepID=A0A8K0N4Z2_COCNU|nr:S-acyltransferase [Cocos nucifera]